MDDRLAQILAELERQMRQRSSSTPNTPLPGQQQAIPPPSQSLARTPLLDLVLADMDAKMRAEPPLSQQAAQPSQAPQVNPSFESALAGLTLKPPTLEGQRHPLPTGPRQYQPGLRGQLMRGLEFVTEGVAGATGLFDPLAEDATTATTVGGAIGELLPWGAVMGGLRGLKKAGQAADAAADTGRSIRAFHGSPAEFDKFDMGKIGTGEGAQAFAYGLYSGEHPDVARGYRDMVPAAERRSKGVLDTNMRIGGKRVEDVYKSLERQANGGQPMKSMTEAQPYFDKMAVLEDLMLIGDAKGVRERGTHTPEAMAWFEKEVAPNFTRKGKLYEVDIHAKHEELLDWDKPLSQQSDAVQKALADIDADMYGANSSDYDPSETGAHIYQRLRSMFGESKASAVLNGKGVKGVKYLDQGSRESGQGTSNYVVFSDELMSIIKKYGVAFPVAAEMLRKQQQESGKK